MKMSYVLSLLVIGMVGVSSDLAVSANNAVHKSVKVLKLVAKSPFIVAGGACGLVSQSIKGEVGAFTGSKDAAKKKLGSK